MEWPLDYVQCSFDDLARMCSDFGKLFSVSLFRWCEGKYFVFTCYSTESHSLESNNK